MLATYSEGHYNPGDIMPPDTFTPYVGAGDILILNGDMCNILPLGMKAWRTLAGRKTIDSIKTSVPKGCQGWYVYGNHEGRLSWLKELMAASSVINDPPIQIVRSIDIPYKGEIWHFEHGHKFCYGWRWLRHVADDIVEWLTSNPLTLKLWYNFSVKRGWLPSKYMHDWEGNPVSKKYRKLVGHYWAEVLAEAHEQNMNYVVGHSHRRVTITTDFVKVIDDGSQEIVLIDF